MNVTRRQLAWSLAATATLAQTSSQQFASPEAELQAARDQVKANVARLSAEPVPMSTEPAFQFKA